MTYLMEQSQQQIESLRQDCARRQAIIDETAKEMTALKAQHADSVYKC